MPAKHKITLNGQTSKCPVMSPKSETAFVRSFLYTFTLWFLTKKPMCGYDIIKNLTSAHIHTASASRIYPILSKLEEMGLVKSKTENIGKRKRKTYSATQLGSKTLAAAKKHYFVGLKKEFFKDMLS